MTQAEHPPPTGLRSLLARLTQGDADEILPLDTLLHGLGRQSFGMLLLIASVPAFVPIPGVGGAIGGPLVLLVGLQLLIGRGHPWLPDVIARRGPKRSTLSKLERAISRWMQRIERLIRPRLPWLLDHWLASMFTGLQLVILALLLALPIPFTNVLFGLILLLYALSMLERDGALMLAAWAAGLASILFFGIISGALVATLTQWSGGWW